MGEGWPVSEGGNEWVLLKCVDRANSGDDFTRNEGEGKKMLVVRILPRKKGKEKAYNRK